MSEQQDTPRGPGRPRKSQVTVVSRRSAALARRLAPGANPFAGGTRHIPLKEPQRWATRIENDYADEGGVYRAIHELGWEPVLVEDLDCRPEDVGLRVNEQGYLVRGEKGREVLLKMPIEDFKEVTRKKTEFNNRAIGSAKKIKDDAANAAAAQFGPEAGDYVDKHMHGEVVDKLVPLSQV